MPRDSQGLYTLPAGNPVVEGTLIEAAWANGTMNDLAQALTDSLPRSGAAPMVGPLTLASPPPTQPRHAASKAYVDQFVAYSSGMPVGSIVSYSAASVPTGFFICNGQAISRTLYPALFALVGVSFGGGDGVSTFNVPNLVNQFIRGRDPATRIVGSVQADEFKSHQHPVTQTDHNHPLTDLTHTHVQSPHTHTQAAHTHTVPAGGIIASTLTASSNSPAYSGAQVTGTATPIINDATAVNAFVSANISIAPAQANIDVAFAGGNETRPQNMAFDFIIKAVDDGGGPPAVLSIDSSDSNMIAIAGTATTPLLNIKANVAFGVVKLDGGNKIPSSLLPVGNQNLLGLYDASTGNNPSQEYPTSTFLNGDTFVVGVQGTINVFDPATNLSAPTLVQVGNELLYIVGSAVNPDGWYYVVATFQVVVASQVGLTPVGGISATNVQVGIEELDTAKAPKASPTFTGTVSGVTATMVASTPVGGVAAINVQAAIQELDSEKVSLNGTGASGTWGISINGNAATATNATTAGTTTGNAATATNPQSGGTFITSANIAAQSVASATNATNAANATYAKQVPVSATATNLTAADAGKCVDLVAGITISGAVMAAGDAVSFYNNTAGNLTLTQGAGMTLALSGVNTGANKTLAAYSICTVWFRTAGFAVVTGSGVT